MREDTFTDCTLCSQELASYSDWDSSGKITIQPNLRAVCPGAAHSSFLPMSLFSKDVHVLQWKYMCTQRDEWDLRNLSGFSRPPGWGRMWNGCCFQSVVPRFQQQQWHLERAPVQHMTAHSEHLFGWVLGRILNFSILASSLVRPKWVLYMAVVFWGLSINLVSVIALLSCLLSK